MNIHATRAEDSLPTGGPDAQHAGAAVGRMKFTYASGSRPLDGYTIKRGIGRGGFGEVYYAVSDGGKEVALKLIRRNFDVELRGVAHCMNLRHPNLLGLHDVRTDQHDDRWVVMEYVTGECLGDVIEANPGGMPPDEATAWMHGIAAGVAYLHECGIVHRDLKPGNIFSDQGLVKIGDYGLSKFISCSRRSGQTESVGTVHYMAPEIANGRYGKEIDIYALGVIFYEMLMGRVPFEGESVGEVLMKHLTAEPDLSALHEPYQSIVRRMLAKDPDVRYRTATELLADLPAVAGGTSRVHVQPSVASIRSIPVLVPSADEIDDIVEAEIAEPPVLAAAVGYPAPPAVPEEPIWRWIKGTLSHFGYAWNNNLNTAAKIVLIVVSLWAFLAMSSVLIPTFIFVTVIYLVYRAIWALTTRSSPAPAMPPAPSPGAVAQAAHNTEAASAAEAGREHQPRRRRGWHKSTLPILPAKTLRTQTGELAGSLVLSAVVCLVTSVVMLLLRGEQASVEQFAWLSLVSIAGTWGVLIPSKAWEGKEGEPALRRFCMLVVGLAIGTGAFYLQRQLWVDLPHEFTFRPVFAQAAEAYSNASIPVDDSNPFAQLRGAYAPESLMTYLSYFGFLFLIIRWWRMADPLRATRLSLWTTALCVTCAGALYMFWPFPTTWDTFPQPWGLMLAATIAVAVQLSSPWLDRQKRHATQVAST